MIGKAAFELSLKIGTVPVFAMPHLNEVVVHKVRESKKFKDYISKIDNCEEGVKVSKI